MQTKSYADAADAADADADGIHTKNNMSPTPSEGGHNDLQGRIQDFWKGVQVHIGGSFLIFLLIFNKFPYGIEIIW